MSNPTFIKEPGYIFDLINIFMYHFNRNYMENCMEYKSKAEVLDLWNQFENKFPQIPDELFLFFYMKDNGKCFLLQYCFYNNVEKYQENFKFECMQQDLLDIDKILFRMIQFYFPELCDEEVEEYRNDLKKLARLIDGSQYSDYIKSKLFLFILDYESIIRKLNYEFVSKETEFKHYYAENYIQISEFQSNLKFPEVTWKISQVKNKKFTIDQKLPVYISPCMIAKGTYIIFYEQNCTVILLGVEVDVLLDYLQNRALMPELEVFGTAVSDKHRMGILNALLERDEMTIREVEKMFNISNTNAYYHLTLMIKAGIIKVRNQGRSMLYSLNRRYFNTLMEALKKYQEKGGEGE